MQAALEGNQIGAYRLVRQIGAGGMGAVWLAEHSMLGRRAAVKVLHPSFTSREEIVTRFFNEARAASSIADPGIVQIFDFGYHEGSAYIVMELLDGEPLDDRLKQHGRLPVGDALRILRQVATSLGKAHARGIVHRDLKPENIFLARDEEVAGGERAKLLDFGIAKLSQDNESGVKTHTSAIMGTPTYMSPEQCRGAGRVDARSDVYALGCVLFTLLTGRPPFVAEGMGEVLVMHLHEPAPRAATLAPWIPAAVDDVIARCLSKDPAERYDSAAELARVYDALLTRISVAEARPPTAVVAVANAPTTLSSAIAAERPPVRRGRAWPIVTLALALGVIVTVTVTQLGGGDDVITFDAPPAAAPRGSAALSEPPAKQEPRKIVEPPSTPSITTPVESPVPPKPLPLPKPRPKPEPKPQSKPPEPQPPEPNPTPAPTSRCKPPMVERNGICIFENR